MRTSERASRPQRNSGVGADTPTADHDKICLWTERNAYRILREVCAKDRPIENWYIPEWEYAISSNGKVQYVIGFVDLRIAVDFVKEYGDRKLIEHEALLLELKPRIESLGAVIRQVKLYQQYEIGGYQKRKPVWGIVSPDDRFSVTLERQGIHFIKCPALTDLTADGIEIDDVPF